jgi:hypothetical protein
MSTKPATVTRFASINPSAPIKQTLVIRPDITPPAGCTNQFYEVITAPVCCLELLGCTVTREYLKLYTDLYPQLKIKEQ